MKTAHILIIGKTLAIHLSKVFNASSQMPALLYSVTTPPLELSLVENCRMSLVKRHSLVDIFLHNHGIRVNFALLGILIFGS